MRTQSACANRKFSMVSAGYLVLQLGFIADLVASPSSAPNGTNAEVSQNTLSLKLDDSSLQLISEYLNQTDLTNLLKLAKIQRRSLLRLNTIIRRMSPFSVLASLGGKISWVYPIDIIGAEQLEDILDLHPQCLEQRAADGTGLLERFPLPSWQEQSEQAAINRIEPRYLGILAKCIAIKIASLTIDSAQIENGVPLDHSHYDCNRTAVQMVLCLHHLLEFAFWNALVGACDAARDCDIAHSGYRLTNVSAETAGTFATQDFPTGLNPAHSTKFTVLKRTLKDSVQLVSREAAAAVCARLCNDAKNDNSISTDRILRVAYRAAELSALAFMLAQTDQLVPLINAATQNLLDAPQNNSGLIISSKKAHHSLPRGWVTLQQKTLLFWEPLLRRIDRLYQEYSPAVRSDYESQAEAPKPKRARLH